MTLTAGERRPGAGGPAAIALIALMAVMFAAGCGDTEKAAETSARGSTASAVEAATGETAVAPGSGSDVTASGSDVDAAALPRLLDLGSDKCVPCKAMAPIIEEMRGTFAGKLSVEFVDVWKDRAAAQEYDIKVIPTQIFLDADGNELFRHQGFFSREEMLAKWRELGYDFER